MHKLLVDLYGRLARLPLIQFVQKAILSFPRFFVINGLAVER